MSGICRALLCKRALLSPGSCPTSVMPRSSPRTRAPGKPCAWCRDRQRGRRCRLPRRQSGRTLRHDNPHQRAHDACALRRRRKVHRPHVPGEAAGAPGTVPDTASSASRSRSLQRNRDIRKLDEAPHSSHVTARSGLRSLSDERTRSAVPDKTARKSSSPAKWSLLAANSVFHNPNSRGPK